MILPYFIIYLFISWLTDYPLSTYLFIKSTEVQTTTHVFSVEILESYPPGVHVRVRTVRVCTPTCTRTVGLHTFVVFFVPNFAFGYD